ncbi:hypothetical protein Tco_0992303 [Tanacetum coccineum]|uniref:Uncharacterized protein n=1 Tax=Tanacetum coccineum TaxID=301880 RepID=A0ABQ5F2H9_9ASTR
MASMGSSPFWNTGTIRPESGWENSDDRVIHTVETDMVKLVVDNECFGMSFNEFDKETGSSDGLQPKQADLSCVHALTEPHLHEIHVLQVSIKLINVSCVQILNQFDISHKFAPLRRKSIQKLCVHLKLLQFHVVYVHVIE